MYSHEVRPYYTSGDTTVDLHPNDHQCFNVEIQHTLRCAFRHATVTMIVTQDIATLLNQGNRARCRRDRITSTKRGGKKMDSHVNDHSEKSKSNSWTGYVQAKHCQDLSPISLDPIRTSSQASLLPGTDACAPRSDQHALHKEDG